MPNQLLQSDRQLFYFVNHTLSNPFFDLIMPWMRNPSFWIPLYLFIIVFCLWKFKKQGLLIIIFIALAAGIADKTSAGIIKPLVHRIRPCRDTITAKTDIERVGCGMGYSFPSTHATDHFSMAFFIILAFRKVWKWIWLWGFLWAGTICFAQVYVGVHYPADVTGGAIYGIFIGWLCWLLFVQVNKLLKFNSDFLFPKSEIN